MNNFLSTFIDITTNITNSDGIVIEEMYNIAYKANIFNLSEVSLQLITLVKDNKHLFVNEFNTDYIIEKLTLCKSLVINYIDRNLLELVKTFILIPDSVDYLEILKDIEGKEYNCIYKLIFGMITDLYHNDITRFIPLSRSFTDNKCKFCLDAHIIDGQTVLLNKISREMWYFTIYMAQTCATLISNIPLCISPSCTKQCFILSFNSKTLIFSYCIKHLYLQKKPLMKFIRIISLFSDCDKFLLSYILLCIIKHHYDLEQ